MTSRSTDKADPGLIQLTPIAKAVRWRRHFTPVKALAAAGSLGLAAVALAQLFPDVVELSDLDGRYGFTLNGVVLGDLTGWAVETGDINGDGVDDLLIGAPFADPFGSSDLSEAGVTYVVFGRADGAFPAALELSALDGTQGFSVHGVDAFDASGRSVAAGDVNGDEVEDLLIGAPYAEPSASPVITPNNGSVSKYAGVTYVVFGRQDGVFPRSIQLSDSAGVDGLDGMEGFAVHGVASYDQSGSSLAAGDVNGDGVDDLLVGAPGAGDRSYYSGYSGSAPGVAYVVFGRDKDLNESFSSPVKLSALNGEDGFAALGVNGGDHTGNSLAAGDVNGDKVEDLLIGAPKAVPPEGPADAGVSYVVYGRKGGVFPASIELSALGSADGFAVYGFGNDQEGTEEAGRSVAAGDVNGDGVDDLFISADRFVYSTGLHGGVAYVVFGRDIERDGDFPRSVELSSLDGELGFAANGLQNVFGVGFYHPDFLVDAGDVDGDGVDDLLIGSPGAVLNGDGLRVEAGVTYVVYGQEGGFQATLELSALTGSNGFAVNGVASYDSSGNSVASGDVNGDGLDDLVVGAPENHFPTGDSVQVRNAAYIQGPGRAYVLFGRGEADLAVTKEAEPTSAAAGSDVSFTITVTNQGPAPAFGVAVMDEFDPDTFDLEAVSWTCEVPPEAGACGEESGSGDISTTVDLYSGAAATFNVKAPLLVTAEGTVTNVASITVPELITDPTPENNEATVTVEVGPALVDLAVTKTATPTATEPGETVLFTITVSNRGPVPVVGASVSDAFDADAFDVGAVSWTCEVASEAGACGATGGSGDIATSVDLNSGAAATFRASAPLLPSAGGTVTNTASASLPPDMTDVVPGNNEDTTSIEVELSGDINRDGWVDTIDLDLLLARLRQPAQQGDRADLDRSGDITVLDARQLVVRCTSAGCETE